MEENMFAPPPLTSEQVEMIRKHLQDVELKGSYPASEELQMCCCEPDKEVNGVTLQILESIIEQFTLTYGLEDD